ncbi:hypothetical protein GGR01_001184 [Acetobacter oeni]|nr:hypothetical protein [Acetobacter oeni]
MEVPGVPAYGRAVRVLEVPVLCTGCAAWSCFGLCGHDMTEKP